MRLYGARHVKLRTAHKVPKLDKVCKVRKKCAKSAKSASKLGKVCKVRKKCVKSA